MKKVFHKMLQRICLFLLVGGTAPLHLHASSEMDQPCPAPVNPLMVIDTLKVIIEGVRWRTEDATHTRFLRKATTLGKVRRKLHTLQKAYDETQERLGLLKEQREEIADSVRGLVAALRRIHYAHNQEGTRLRNRIRISYLDAGFRSRAHFESQLAREEETLKDLSWIIKAREALLEMNTPFTQPSKQDILLEIETRYRTLDLTNTAVKHAVGEALEDVFCLQ